MERVDSPKSLAMSAYCRKFATSSRSTRTRNCRAIRHGKWSGRWPIRSIGRCSIRTPPGRGRLRHHAAARRREPAQRPSVVVRAAVRGRRGSGPYTRVVSDLYQDLFGEGSFVGKGIYDVDAFEQCCGDFPENAILSHDLLESAYVRSALLSDVELYEDSPRAIRPTSAGGIAGYAATGRLPGGCCRGCRPCSGKVTNPDRRAIVVEDL